MKGYIYVHLLRICFAMFVLSLALKVTFDPWSS